MITHDLGQADRRRGERRRIAGDAGGQVRTHRAHTANYGRFWAMVVTSTAIGFGAMYLNTYELDHVYFSWTRVYMAMIMGGVMTAVMMVFMWGMYPNRRANAAILGVAAGVFVAGLALVRAQATVGDDAYMRAMIPHHSIAILTSSRAHLQDPRVRELADGIIETQRKEIEAMKQLISDLGR